MRLKIGLATLISLISITGVAVAATGGLHVFGINLPVAAPASNSEFKMDSEYGAINCWAVTGGSNGASCATSADAPGIPGLPGLPELDLPTLPSLPGVPSLPGLSGLPGLPTACGLPVAGLVPAPTSSLKVATDALEGAESTLKSAIAGLPVPPLPLPIAVPSVTGTLTKELGCATTSAAPASTPELCKVSVPGLPVALPVPVPAEASAVLGSIAKDVKNLTGQSLPAIGGTTVGANCSVDSSTLPNPTSLIPSPTSLIPSPSSVTKGLKVPQPSSLVPGLPTLPNVDKVLGGLSIPGVSGGVGTVTGLVTDVLSVVGAPSCSGSVSGGLISGVLGSISGSATASC
jgi:hypothetical protein